MNFVSKKCVPCEGGVSPLARSEAERFLSDLPGWILTEDAKKIFREFTFKDFKEAIRFINAVSEVAEAEGHHPDIYISWNRARLELWTHSIAGLSENDFILAAKIQLLKSDFDSATLIARNKP